MTAWIDSTDAADIFEVEYASTAPAPIEYDEGTDFNYEPTVTVEPAPVPHFFWTRGDSFEVVKDDLLDSEEEDYRFM